MIYGMSEEQFEILNRMVLLPLKQHGAKVFIFGSRATGQHHPYSDVDLLYKADTSFPSGFIAKIQEAIEESRFPFTVDLVAEENLASSYRPSVIPQMKPI